MIRYFFFLFALAFFILPLDATVTDNDGDWALQNVVKTETPEAALMVRYGDIDNLGFGWPSGFDPFSGNSTPIHSFPWSPPADETDGTDRIMVITSYTGQPPNGSDGYSNTTRPENSVRPITLSFDTELLTVSDATFQIFVDDFQAPVWNANYTVTLNGQSFPAMASVVNSLSQTGPIGKLITVPVPASLLPEVATGSVSLVFDDLTTGAGDGYAIDFVKLLINRGGDLQSGDVSGTVTDADSGSPLEGARVNAFQQSTLTASDGSYLLEDVPAGIAFVTANADGHGSASRTFDLVAGTTVSGQDFALPRSQLVITIARGPGPGQIQTRFYGQPEADYELRSGTKPGDLSPIETIVGSGGWIERTHDITGEPRRFWSVTEF